MTLHFLIIFCTVASSEFLFHSVEKQFLKIALVLSTSKFDRHEGRDDMQRDLDSLEEWSYKTSSSVTRPSARPCRWVRAIPNVSTGWGMKGMRAEKDLTALMDEKTVQLHWKIQDQVEWGFEHPGIVNDVHSYSNREMTRWSSKVSFNPTYSMILQFFESVILPTTTQQGVYSCTMSFKYTSHANNGIALSLLEDHRTSANLSFD